MSIRKMVFLIIAILLCLAIVAACAQSGTCKDIDTDLSAGTDDVVSAGADVVSEATMDRYDEREIREYEGIQLDPSVGPRDNSISGIQTVDIDDYTLSITGLVDTPLSLTYDEVLEYPAYARLITLYCVEGWDATILWEGVKTMDLVDAAGMNETANTIIFKAVDGYTTSIPIDTIIERDMILAYKSNEIDLPAAMGYPFIVVAEDKLGYKWARWVTEIEVSDEENYLGYWEERGYGNTADVPEN